MDKKFAKEALTFYVINIYDYYFRQQQCQDNYHKIWLDERLVAYKTLIYSYSGALNE